MATLNARFEVASWDEASFDGTEQADGGSAKITRAVVDKSYAGDVIGTSATEWLMAYEPDGRATFVGMERITGSVGGREGTLVLQHVGRFADGAATAALTVLGGTGQLDGVNGSGDFIADPEGRIELRLDLSAWSEHR